MDRCRPAAHRIVSLTTEAGERVAVSEDRPRSATYGESFMVSFDKAGEHMARHVTSAATFRVWGMLTHGRLLGWEVWQRVPQRELAAQLELRQASVSRAMAELHQLGLVDRRGGGAVVEWRLTTHGAWRGNVASFQAARRARQEAEVEVETLAAIEEIAAAADQAGASPGQAPEPACEQAEPNEGASADYHRSPSHQRQLRLLGNLPPGGEAA